MTPRARGSARLGRPGVEGPPGSPTPRPLLPGPGPLRRHPDGSQDPGLRAVRCLALGPDFRQDDGWGVGRGSLPSSGAWLCADSVCAGQSLPAPRRAPAPACSEPRHRRHPDESQDPGLRAVRCLALGPDFRQYDGWRWMSVFDARHCAARLGLAWLGLARLGPPRPSQARLAPPPPRAAALRNANRAAVGRYYSLTNRGGVA